MNILFRILFVAMMALESHAIATIMIKAGETSKTYSGTSILSAGVFAAADAAGYWIIEVDSPESSTFRIYTKPSANYLNEKCDYYLAAVDGGTTLFAIPASEGVLEFFPDSPTVFRFDTLRIALSKHITKYTQFTSKGQGTGDCYVTLTHDDTGAGLGNDVEAVRFNAQSWFGVSLAKIEATRFTVAITPHELYLNPVTQPQASHRGDALEKIESVWWRDELQPSSSKSEQLIVYRLHADFNLPVPLLVWYYGVRALSSDMRPDFVITGVTINGSKALKSGGDTLKAEVTIKNQGSEYGNLNAIEWGLANANVSTVNNLTLFVAPGAITKVQIEGSVNSGPGTYALNLKLNPGGPSDGSNERDYGNNTVQKTFVVMGPDYTVSAITFSPPAPLSPGQRFSAKVTIKNVGSETGPSFYGNSLAVWTDRPAEPATGEISGAVIGDWNYMKVNASQTVTFDNLKAPDAPGTYTFRAFADCYDVVAEQRNDNNQKAMTYTVNGPDYIVDTIRLIPAKPLAGQSFDAEVVIKNQGKGSGPGIGPGMIHAWVHRPDAPAVGDTEGGVTLPAQTAAIPDIGAGRSQKVVFRSLTAPVTPGSYTFRVFVDSAGDIAETAENNNQRTVSYTVYQGAGVPVPTGPQGKQFGASQTYAWSAASFASSYDLLIEYLNAGTGVWLTFKSLPGLKVTTTTLTGHKEGFSYRWRVRANNANGAGAWSDAMAFTVAVTPIVPLPGAPEGYEPAGTVTDSTPRFWWSPGSDDWTSHRLVIAKGGTVVRDIDGIEAWEYTPTAPLADGDYTWYVATVNASGQGPWSDPIAFSVDTVMQGDDFNRSDSDSVGNRWAIVGDTASFSISSGALHVSKQYASNVDRVEHAVSPGFNNVKLRIETSSSSGGSQVQCWFNTGSYTIDLNWHAGVVSVNGIKMESLSVARNTWYGFEFRLAGDKADVFVDGVQQLSSVPLSSSTTSSSVELGVGGVSGAFTTDFDYIQVGYTN